MAIDQDMKTALRDLSEARKALDVLDIKSEIGPGGEIYTLTDADLAAIRRADEAWRAYLALARQRWAEVEF